MQKISPDDTTVHARDFAAALLVTLGPMTGMKLQKLLYYIQAWHLARFDSRAFVEDIEAWANGPVVRSVYALHRKTWMISAIPSGDASNIQGTRQDVLRWVSDAYGGFSAEKLSEMTHAEVPWLVARGALPDGTSSSTAIEDELMGNFYARQTLSPTEAIASAAASAALEDTLVSYNWQQAVLNAAEAPGGVDALIAQRLQESGVQ